MKPKNWNEEFIWTGYQDDKNEKLLEWYYTPCNQPVTKTAVTDIKQNSDDESNIT